MVNKNPVRREEKEYLGAGMGFLIHNILWPRGQRNVKNPMASLAFQGRPGAPKAIHKTHPGQPWKAGPKAVNDAWRSTMVSMGWKKDESTIL